MYKTSRGFPTPFGPTIHPNGVNFSLFSKHAKEVSLCLFRPKEESPYLEIALNPLINKTGDVWHIFLFDIPHNLEYGYRLNGDYDPLQGHYFDPRLIVLDPYAKLLSTQQEWGQDFGAALSHLRRGIVAPERAFHWGDDKPPKIPLKDLIIYEMHVRGFTQDNSSRVENPGTYLGLIEKIPYLKSLGVNAVELLPIFEFQERQNSYINPKTNDSLYQYWGYSTVNFFAPMNRYSSVEHKAILEFKTMVKELHAAGIEVILDVVYNHTAEGNQNGPIISFKGIENPVYYMLGPNGEYYNFSGCGNTLNCNHPVVRELISQSLRYWVIEMHVDGFRFDLASVLTRSPYGYPLQQPPLIERITQDPVLANTKLIAEAWDAAGLYQVGTFPAMGVFAEWNGVYRDGVRRFLRGCDGAVGNFATRLSGSEDLYGKGRTPAHSINFVTAHDGFTLADLVSYNEKHNEENGEQNRDGTSDNESWNCGIEGPTNEAAILALRERQMRNFHLCLMTSQGVPMIQMGDEYGHTKFGNNNTWGHDSRLNWFQWDMLEKNPHFFRFYKLMIAFRKEHPILRRTHFLGERDVIWHGKEFNHPDWSGHNRFLGLSLPDLPNKYELYIAFNAHPHEITFALPPANSYFDVWLRIVDTSKPSPDDFVEGRDEKIDAFQYTLPGYSSLLLKRKSLVTF